MRTLVFGVVLLAATAAQAEDRNSKWYAEDRKCSEAFIDRQCNKKNYVTNPNEYGWRATSASDCRPEREKGFGWKQKKDVACDCLPQCRGGE